MSEIREREARRLASAVIAAALKDAVGKAVGGRAGKSRREELREDAVAFFLRAAAGREEALWFELAGVDPEDALKEALKEGSCRVGRRVQACR